ncbi:ankyrin repeat domain-containing protein [Bacteriovoracales bacterium]|nr:ankyrin repeat domain-containing protein [Bacteriovoracales bacterium]
MHLKKLIPLFILLFLASCSSTSKLTSPKKEIKKDDTQEFGNELNKIDKGPELHQSSALLLKYQNEFDERQGRKKRAPASVEDAEELLEDAPEEIVKEDPLVEEIAEESEVWESDGEEMVIDTPPELTTTITDSPSPFEIKELPPTAEMKAITTPQEEKVDFPKTYFPHKIPEIKDGSILRAAKRATVETIRYLLEKGLNINFRDRNGNTALHHAVFGKRPENITFLINSGADPGLKNKKGLNPKELALKKKNEALAQLFP